MSKEKKGAAKIFSAAAITGSKALIILHIMIFLYP